MPVFPLPRLPASLPPPAVSCSPSTDPTPAPDLPLCMPSASCFPPLGRLCSPLLPWVSHTLESRHLSAQGPPGWCHSSAWGGVWRPLGPSRRKQQRLGWVPQASRSGVPPPGTTVVGRHCEAALRRGGAIAQAVTTCELACSSLSLASRMCRVT